MHSKRPHPGSHTLGTSRKFRRWEKTPQQNGEMVLESLWGEAQKPVWGLLARAPSCSQAVAGSKAARAQAQHN